MGSAIAVTIGAGIAVAVQVWALGSATRSADPLAVSFALQIAGGLLGAGWVLVRGTQADVGGVIMQWWWLPVGLVGWAIVGALGFAAARAGITTTLSILVAAQLITSLGIDRSLGEVELGPRHLLGVALLVFGAALTAGRG